MWIRGRVKVRTLRLVVFDRVAFVKDHAVEFLLKQRAEIIGP